MNCLIIHLIPHSNSGKQCHIEIKNSNNLYGGLEKTHRFVKETCGENVW